MTWRQKAERQRLAVEQQNGLSLLEQMICLLILALLTLLALPSQQQDLDRQRGRLVMNDLARLIAMGRQAAIHHGSPLTLCRSSDGRACNAGGWEDGALLFVDYKGNRTLDAEDLPLTFRQNLGGGGSLRFSAFQNRQTLQFSPQGFTRHQNGNFTWCPPDQDPRQAQQLIISQSGRSRLARDSNGDGIAEDSQGRPLQCP